MDILLAEVLVGTGCPSPGGPRKIIQIMIVGEEVIGGSPIMKLIVQP